MYVLQCMGNGHNNGKYVAKSGSTCSYTLNINDVRKFASIEEAIKNKCGNERVVSISDI